uniref:hypothetical protein n=1 Tax=Anaplasma marginale TaxID=770 RepID=UPI0005B4D38F
LSIAVAIIASISVLAAIGSNFETRQRNSNSEILGIAALGVGGVGLTWYLAKKNRYKLNFDSNSLTIDRANRKLQQKLLRLISDRKTANRLVEGAKKSNPDRSIDWLVEKVIYDLERDRV